MNAIAWLCEHGPRLALGSTIVLAGGIAAMAVARGVAAQRRLGALTVLGAAVYLLLGALPLQRWSLPQWLPTDVQQPLALPAALSLDPVRTSAPAPRPAAVSAPRQEVPVAPALAVPTIHREATTPTAPPLPWPQLLAALWIAGATWTALRLLLGLGRIHRVLRRSSDAASWLAAAVALPPRTRVRIAEAAVRPFCTGVLRPRIVLPASLGDAAHAGQATAVLRHEVAHVRANDPALQLLCAALSVPLFWHPLFWWLRARVRFCGELLADDAAARSGVHDYARHLLDLADGGMLAIPASTAVSVFHRRSEFARRIQMLLQRERPLSSPTRTSALAQFAFTVALVATTAGFCGTPLRAQNQDPVAARQEAELRDTIAALRAEIAQLQRQIEGMHAGAEAPATDPTLPTAPRPLYTVEAGDSLARIAAKAHTDVDALVALNPGLDATHLRIGQKIAVPETEETSLLRKQWLATVQDLILAQGLQGATGATPTPGGMPLGLTGIPGGGGLTLPGVGGALPSAIGATPAPPRGGDGMGTQVVADLALRFLDLQGDVRAAELQCERMRPLAEAGAVSTHELGEAQLRRDLAQRKLAVADRLLATEADSLRAEIVWLKAMRERGDAVPAGDARLTRAHGNLATIESVRGTANSATK